MKTLIGALLLVAFVQPNSVLADGRGRGAYPASGAVVVGGGRYGPPRGYYGPRGGYYGPRGGYRGGSSVGVYFGAPLGWGWPWGAPAYYPQPVYPQVVTVPPPVVYVERDEASVASESGQTLYPGYWYYCRELAAYYPVVIQCPGTWEPVAPRPD